jgi:hypothetical protein
MQGENDRSVKETSESVFIPSTYAGSKYKT